MAVHPGVSIRSLYHTFNPPPSVAFRHRGLTRRKRAAPGTTTRMAADSGCGRRGGTSSNFNANIKGSNGNVNSNRMSSRFGSGNISLAAAATASGGRGLGAFSGNVERPPDGARDMQVDGDEDDDVGSGGGSSGGGGGGGGGSGGASGGDGGGGSGGSGGGDFDVSHRTNRVLSCPADKREARPDLAGKGLGLGLGLDLGLGRVDVSSARGITMDAVFGTVRSKTSPAASTAAIAAAAPAPELRRPESAGSLRSMVDLAAAVNEASAEKSAAVSSPARPAVVELTMELRGVDAGAGGGVGGGRGGGGETERVYRATSSAGLLVTGGAKGSQGPTKRAKSGVTSVGASMALAPGRIQEPDRAAAATDATPLGAGAVTVAATAGAAAAVAGAAAASRRGPGSSTRCVTESEEGAGGGAAAAAVGEASWTNEAWLALLAPLRQTAPAGTHPEDFLHDILRERGYTVEMVSMKETKFHRVPEPAQVSAYDKAILNAVLEEDEAALERMRASGRRMDACNRFGDSVLHMACRRGRAGALRYLLRVCGRSGVVLSDDFGRTLMHDACWTATPRFDVVSAVLDADTRLLRMLDTRGSSPLQYVPQDQWPLWCAFFESRKEVYWPSLAAGQEDTAGVIPRRSTMAVSNGE